MKRSIILALAACLLGALSVGALSTAATKQRSTTTTTSGPPPTMKEALAEQDAERDAQLKKIADDLSVSLDDLKDALKGVRDDELAADVKANRLTQAQADALKACAAAPLTCDRSNLPAYHFHRGGRGKDRDAFYAAVAKKLGKETADVQKAFEANRPARGAGRGRGHHGGPGPGGPGGPPPGGMRP